MLPNEGGLNQIVIPPIIQETTPISNTTIVNQSSNLNPQFQTFLPTENIPSLLRPCSSLGVNVDTVQCNRVDSGYINSYFPFYKNSSCKDDAILKMNEIKNKCPNSPRVQNVINNALSKY